MKAYLETVNRIRTMSVDEEQMTDVEFSNILLKEGLVAYQNAALAEMVKRGDAQLMERIPIYWSAADVGKPQPKYLRINLQELKA